MTTTELLTKYDVPGPRYTSYPTVPYWTRAPSQAEWFSHLEQSLQRGKEAGEGASIYVHIPYCRSLCHYCGCNNFITRDHSVGRPYVETVLAEWALYTSRLGAMRVDEVHLGGGTPTFLTPDELELLIDGLKARANFSESAELSIEADPRVTGKEQLATLAKLGFRRLSLGIQDFDPAVQRAVNRTQTEREVQALTCAARELGFWSVNYDLIYGLPKQTPQSIKGTMDAVLRLKPDRIAFYGYAHVPWMKSVQRKFTDQEVPGGAEKRVLYETGLKLLADSGYLEIGMDHFALASDSLWKAYQAKALHRNFMGYTARRTIPMFGLGVSSIGDTWTAFAQNEKVVADYERRVKQGEVPIARGHLLDEEDQVLRQQILNVMTRFETDWAQARPRVSYLDSVSGRLEEMRRDGLIELGDDRVRVTDAGRPFVRNICMALDARLARQAPDRQIFSRTI